MSIKHFHLDPHPSHHHHWGDQPPVSHMPIFVALAKGNVVAHFVGPFKCTFSDANRGCHSNCGLKRSSPSKWGIRTFKKWNTPKNTIETERQTEREGEKDLLPFWGGRAIKSAQALQGGSWLGIYSLHCPSPCHTQIRSSIRPAIPPAAPTHADVQCMHKHR